MERAKLERERERRLAAERELDILRQQLETERSRREAAELAIHVRASFISRKQETFSKQTRCRRCWRRKRALAKKRL